MSINNAVNNSLTGQTGTGNFVGSDTPTLSGIVTSDTMQFSPDTNGILGAVSGSSASTGYVGELMSQIILSASAINWTGPSSTYQTVCMLPLTAGDWDIWGNIFCILSGTTGVNGMAVHISTNTSAIDPAYANQVVGTLTNNVGLSVPSVAITVSSPVNYYSLIALQYAALGGTPQMCGTFWARRRR